MIYSSAKEAQVACREWQEILRLRDWDITVGIRRKKDLSTGESAGEINWIFRKKMAKISLLSPLDWEEPCDWAQDHEKTLVHELIHIHLITWSQLVKETDVELEQAIESLSCALVELKRKREDLISNQIPSFEIDGDVIFTVKPKEGSIVIEHTKP